VFGVATVVGPLLGGFLVEHLSWRWIFYINLPLGALALVVIGAVFKPRVQQVKHVIDYMGAGWLAAALTCLILFTSEGGSLLPWNSPQLWLTLLMGVVAVAGFIHEEKHAVEPIMPLALFRQRTFVLSSLIGFIVGVSLFGSVTFLPLYLQVVKGSTPSQAGVQMLPMMGGVLVMSMVAGRIISKIGKYRMFPILGTGCVAVAMMLLARLEISTPITQMYLYMGLLGCGLGMVMQVLILAVQNTVEFRHMGVATSGATLFRSIARAAYAPGRADQRRCGIAPAAHARSDPPSAASAARPVSRRIRGRAAHGLSVGGVCGGVRVRAVLAHAQRAAAHASLKDSGTVAMRPCLDVTLIGGQLCALLVLVVLQQMLTTDELKAWGWRMRDPSNEGYLRHEP
jgi:predicted MFS family arabinose efflux permease